MVREIHDESGESVKLKSKRKDQGNAGCSGESTLAKSSTLRSQHFNITMITRISVL